MLTKLRQRLQDEKGFTLIELLVVVLIIGILAAIALPVFLNQAGKSKDARAKADVRTAASMMESCNADNEGSYSAPSDCSAQAGLPNNVTATSTAKGYSLTEVGDTGHTWKIVRDDPSGNLHRDCTGGAGCTGTSW